MSSGMFDFGRLADQARERMRRAEELQERLAPLVGVGSTDDGSIRVSCTPREGISKIEIQPRAMRLGSEELGEQLIRLIGEAQRALQAQVREVTAETMGATLDPDSPTGPVNAEARMRSAMAAFESAKQGADAMMSNLQRQMRR